MLRKEEENSECEPRERKGTRWRRKDRYRAEFTTETPEGWTSDASEVLGWETPDRVGGWEKTEGKYLEGCLGWDPAVSL